MPYFTIEVDSTQNEALQKVMDRQEGRTRVSVVRAVLAYFLKLSEEEQEKLLK